MTLRINAALPHLNRYKSTHARKYLSWGLTPGEFQTHLLYALWQTIEYRDQHPDDFMEFYQRFWWQSRAEFARVWAHLSKAQGRKQSEAYDLDKTLVIVSDDLVDLAGHDNDDPADHCALQEALDGLTDRQRAVLDALPGSTDHDGVVARTGLSGRNEVTRQLDQIRTAIVSDKAPQVQGIIAQVMEKCGVKRAAATRRIQRAREALGIYIPRGGSYTRQQEAQVMAWIQSPANSLVPASSAPDHRGDKQQLCRA